MIPLLVPQMPSAERILPYLQEIDRNRRYTNFGPLNQRLEQRIAADTPRLADAHHAVTMANCTLGIELALQAHGLPPGSRVLVPSLTFVATATAIERAGHVPHFADVDADTWCLTPEIAARACGATRIDAVLAVSTFGKPQDVLAWDAFTAAHRIPVIVDAAGAFGNQAVGRSTDVVFSFHATKTFGTGEGGAVLSADPVRAERVRRLSNFGLDTTRGLVVEAGTNAKLSEYHAAVGLAGLDGWAETQAARRSLMARYRGILDATCPGLVHQQRPADGVYALMVVALPPPMLASDAIAAMASAGVECRRWYCPVLHRHPAFERFGGMQPIEHAERIGERIIGLPFHLLLQEQDIVHIATSLRDVVTATPRTAANGALA